MSWEHITIAATATATAISASASLALIARGQQAVKLGRGQ